MKKIRYIFCMILSLIQIYIPSAVFADTSANLDSDTGIMSVSGSYEHMADKRITVQILNPGITEEDILLFGEKSFEEIFANAFETDADSKGVFQTPEFRLDKSGSYSARITYAGNDSEPIFVKDLCRFVSNEDKTLISEMIKENDAD